MLIEIISISLNPADYKMAEMGPISNIMISKPASPGMDFSGRVVVLGQMTDVFNVGGVVFSRIDTSHFRALRHAPGARGLDGDLAAGVGTAGLTAYQTIVPNVKAGDKTLINSGSGSVGTFGIQIAKAVGCHVMASCSAWKIEMCKEYGADEFIDYTNTDVTQKLFDNGLIYALIVDNVGTSRADLFTRADKSILPAGKFVQVGGSASLETARVYMSGLFLPRILGGGCRRFEAFVARNSKEYLGRIAGFIDDKVKASVEQVFEYEDVPRSIELMKKAGSKGKIIVHMGNG